MPNGVICAGAVEGSNQLGAIVTCQAMTDSPVWASARPARTTGSNATARMNETMCRAARAIASSVVVGLSPAGRCAKHRPEPAGGQARRILVLLPARTLFGELGRAPLECRAEPLLLADLVELRPDLGPCRVERRQHVEAGADRIAKASGV